MNIFQIEYEIRLQSWHDLKEKTKALDIKEKCIEIDRWWQQAPTVNHYLHLMDTKNWPGPWELLVENLYCEVARGLGMCYTLYMIGEKSIELTQASDKFGNDVVLVLVDRAKYILNYWPDTVVNNCLNDFALKKSIDLTNLLQKLQ
jgi:hypothetical protein